MSLDGFSMHPLIFELNQSLSGGRIDRVFQPNKHTIILQIRQPRKNLILHISINPQNPVINLLENTMDNPPAPPIFCMVLRKQIEDGRIAEIKQSSLDRIVEIDIDIRGAGGHIVTKTLIIELMGKYSNIILTQDTIIIDSLKKIGTTTSRVRQVLPNLVYTAPPLQNKLNILTCSTQKFFQALINQPSATLVKALIATGIGIGPITAKELVWLAGFPFDITVDMLSPTNHNSLITAIDSLKAQIQNYEITPTVILNNNKNFLAIASFPLHHLAANKITKTFTNMSQAVDYSTKISGNYIIPEKVLFVKIIKNELLKATHKLTILEEELEQAFNAEQFKINADILITYQYMHKKNKTDMTVTLPNLYGENTETETVTISINPLLTLSQNAQRYYTKYNKAKRAQELLALQIGECQEAIRYLSSIENSLECSATLQEITEIKLELIQLGYLAESKKKKYIEKPSQPLKIFSPDQTIILIGKNNYQNDRLTKQAQSNDIWLHTKDIPGSHVIIKTEGLDISEETLTLAAQLAAYFSKAKASTKIPVDYTKRHYVKKPAKANPGFVIYTNQKTLYVSPDIEMIENLIAALH